jgi:phosphatidylglycerol:prolipoprotein diacylglycerol transferase
MRPTLIDFGIDLPMLGRLDIPAYFTAIAISFLVGLYMMRREASKLGLDRERIYDLWLVLILWAIVGARLMHILADGHLHDYVNLCVDNFKVAATEAKVAHCNASSECGWDYVCNLAAHTCHPPRDCLAIFKVWRGGLAYYGGFIFASVFGILYARKHRMGMWKVADLAAPWIAFGLAVTRLGCYLNGCCYGKVSHLPWAVHFPRSSSVWEAQHNAGMIPDGAATLPVHPTQIYLALLDLGMFFLLYFVVRRRKRLDGQVFAWLLIIKAVLRSFVEIFRDDDRGVFFGWLSTSQLLSLPLLAAGLYLLLRGLRSPWLADPAPAQIAAPPETAG